MNNSIKSFSLFLFFSFILSCSGDGEVEPDVKPKEETPEIVPQFKTVDIETPDFNYAYFKAEIDDAQESTIINLIEDHGFVWSERSGNSLENSNVESKGTKESNQLFATWVRNLSSNTTYYFRAFIKMNGNVYYSNENTFKTKPGTWKKLADFPGEGFANATGFAVNNKGYIVGVNEVWEYDPELDNWTKKSDGPFYAEAPTSFVIKNTGYVYCGFVYEYDQLNDKWTQISATSKGCRGVSSIVIGDNAFIGSGVGTLNMSFDKWNPEIDEWTSFTSLINPNRSHASGFVLGGKGYIIGGDMWVYEEDKSLIEYDFNSQSSQYIGAFINDKGYKLNRREMVCFVINDEVFVGMGYGEPPTGGAESSQVDFYKYNPNNKNWTPQTFPGYIDAEGEIHRLNRAGGVYFTIGNRAFMGLGADKKFNFQTMSYDLTLYNDFWEFIPG